MQLGKIKLRPYQAEAVNNVISHIRDCWTKKAFEPAIVNAYVASGKSLMIGAISAYASSKNRRVLILARQVELVDQNAEKCWLMDCNNSLFLAKPKPRSTRFPVVVSTEGTAANALNKEFKSWCPDIILIDECHMVDWRDVMTKARTQYGKILKHFQDMNPLVAVVGFTGSPYRGVETIMGQYWQKELVTIDMTYLIDNSFIVPTIFGLPDFEYDLSEFDQFNELGTADFSKAELDNMAHKIEEETTLTDQIIRDVVEHTKDRNGVLVTCASKSHCEQVVKYLKHYRQTACIITGDTPGDERERLLNQAKAGMVKFVCQIGCLTTGVDVPLWDTSVILRRIGSLTLLVQLLGRGMRLLTPELKTQGYSKHDHLVLDYSGTMDAMSELFNNPILEEAQLKIAEKKQEFIDCPACGTQNSTHAKRCMGVSSTSKDGRCEFFFSEPIICPKCQTPNSSNARQCRECRCELVDPNLKLSGKHYSDNDFIEVKKMNLVLTKNNGIVVNFDLSPKQDQEQTKKATLFFNPQGSQGAKKMWKHNFVDRFVNCETTRRRVMSMNPATAVKMQAMFATPTHITARKNDKGYFVVHGLWFKNRKLMGNKEVSRDDYPKEK
jgi:superfamily II DNA or RNA helicase